MNALLLFLLLESATGLTWPSLMVAALFALHPINVESVAWASERKNVLSMFFFLLTLHAYGWYVRRGGVKRYAAVAALFALGLMAKSEYHHAAVCLAALGLLAAAENGGRIQFSRAQFPVPGSQFSANGLSNTEALARRFHSHSSFWCLRKCRFFCFRLAVAFSTCSRKARGGAVHTTSTPGRFGNCGRGL